MTEQETVAPPSGKRTEVSAPDRLVELLDRWENESRLIEDHMMFEANSGKGRITGAEAARAAFLREVVVAFRPIQVAVEQRVAALEDGLRMMVEVFADGSGVHSAAAAYCTLSDEGHASIAKARALLSEGSQQAQSEHQKGEGDG